MSLDYPKYHALKKRSRWPGVLWRISDTGYYVGLVGAFGTLLWLLLSTTSWASFRLLLPQAGLLFLSFLLVFGGAVVLKGFVHHQESNSIERRLDDH